METAVNGRLPVLIPAASGCAFFMELDESASFFKLQMISDPDSADTVHQILRQISKVESPSPVEIRGRVSFFGCRVRKGVHYGFF